MTVTRSVAEALSEHVTLEVECIDRLYLNLYQPLQQTPGGAAHIFRSIRGNPVPSPALMAPITRDFVAAIEAFADENGIDLIRFEKGERTQAQVDPATGSRTPSLAFATAMLNAYNSYAVDEDFGPFFLEFCSYFPYNDYQRWSDSLT